MTYLVGDEKPSLEDLAHHGVKGMKWGVVRKNLNDVHAEKVRAGIRINERVASGKGSRTDKAKVALGTPVGRLATRGLKGAAAKNAQLQRDHLKHLDTGKATVHDVLQKYGSLTALDVAAAVVRTHNG
jgi:hypothetical protein